MTSVTLSPGHCWGGGGVDRLGGRGPGTPGNVINCCWINEQQCHVIFEMSTKKKTFAMLLRITSLHLADFSERVTFKKCF